MASAIRYWSDTHRLQHAGSDHFTHDEQTREQLVSKVAVQSLCFSDHHLLSADLPSRSAATTASHEDVPLSFTSKNGHGSLPSVSTFCNPGGSVNWSWTPTAIADLFDDKVKRVLDIHAPLQTSGQHDSRHLSDEAQQAKKQRRRLIKRRYRRTDLHSDKQAYLAACPTARESILKSRADHIKSELDEAAGDICATWRTVQKLFHGSNVNVVYDDAHCAPTSLYVLPVLR